MEGFKICIITCATAIAMVCAADRPFAAQPSEQEMSKSAFDVWLVNQLKAPTVTLIRTSCGAVTTRLTADRQVSDQAIRRCLEALASAEETNRNEHDSQKRFAATFQFIAQVEPLIQERQLLLSELFYRKGSLLIEGGEFEMASLQFRKALSFAAPMSLSVEQTRLRTLVSLGQSLLSASNTMQAEKCFLEVLAYPFYIVDDPKGLAALRDIYIRAGVGLIELRRHNLDALQRTVFVPSTMDVLGPILERALNEAKQAR